MECEAASRTFRDTNLVKQVPKRAIRAYILPAPLMTLLVTLEEKLGRLAIPNIVRVIAVFQALNWFLVQYSPAFGAMLMFDAQGIMSGQVWRIVSHVLLPGSTSILWLLFGVPFLWMINDGLEEAWGSFRLNLYLFAGILFVTIGGLLFPGASLVNAGWILMATLLFAFAVYFPDQEIYLFMIIPIKMKWLAALTAGSIFFTFIKTPVLGWHIGFSLLNFFITFGPGLIKAAQHKGEVVERRLRFAKATAPEAEFFHQCKVCSKTEIDDPALDFRITESGDEICDMCRKRA